MSGTRFTLIMTLRDNYGCEMPISIAIGVDHEVKISNRAVDNMKTGAEFGLCSFKDAVELIRSKEFRRDLFTRTAANLGTLLVERMEDAEGWHDTSRIEPARAELNSAK